MSWAFTPSGGVTETYAAGLLRGMLEIPSPSYQERALADFLAESMADLGFRAYIDVVGNVIGVIERGDGPTLMLLGHLDTVAGQLPVRAEDGRLHGRGAVDAKGPLAAMICAAAGAVDFPGRIVVIGVVEEETPCSRGAMAIRATHDPPDVLIVGEPSGWSSLILGYKGKLDLRYTVTRPATHPSNPAPKASELAVGCWAALVDLLGPDAGHGVFDQPGATLCQLNGDLTTATADLSVRTPPGFDVDALVCQLRDRLPAGTVEVVNSVAACRVDRSTPVVRALVSGIRRLHARPRLLVKTATSDMNTLAEVWDVVGAENSADTLSRYFTRSVHYSRRADLAIWSGEALDLRIRLQEEDHPIPKSDLQNRCSRQVPTFGTTGPHRHLAPPFTNPSRSMSCHTSYVIRMMAAPPLSSTLRLSSAPCGSSCTPGVPVLRQRVCRSTDDRSRRTNHMRAPCANTTRQRTRRSAAR